MRASRVIEEAGGKALHAARVASALGADSRVVMPLGGPAGRRVESLLAGEGVEVVGVDITDATRQTYTVVDDAGGDVIEVIEPSPRLSASEVTALRTAVAGGCAGASVVVCCGSWPAGLDLGFGAWLIETARLAGARTVVDTSGTSLSSMLVAGPDLIAPNRREAAEAVGVAGDGTADVLAAELCDRGPRAVLVTDGPRGAVLAARAAAGAERWRFRPPQRPVVNAVGCGDAVVGGIAYALADGRRLVDAVTVGLAAAADKLGRLEGGHVEADGVHLALPDVLVERLPDARRGSETTLTAP